MNIYELIGFIIGDGNIYYNSKYKVYRLELVGNVEEEADYFDKIEKFLKDSTGRDVIKFVRKERQNNRSLRIQFNNKEFIDRLISLGLPKGKKTYTIQVPKEMLTKDKMYPIIRELFQVDGSLYFSKSKKLSYPSYPRLEIKSSSEVLINQLKDFLEQEGFNIYLKKPLIGFRTYAIQISGEKMLELWIKKIGFSSLKNETKYNIWKAKGFYTPHTQLKHRIEICGGGTAATAVDSI